MHTSKESTLYLIPLPISDADINWSIPSMVLEQICVIQCFIVENAKTARHFIKQVNPAVKWDETLVFELDKHNLSSQVHEIRKILNSNTITGLMSEAGLPCIADPGNHVVRLAHENGIRVRPLTGPSSIILALVSSGLNGQNFTFNGYLPSKPGERQIAIKKLEKLGMHSTQLFIEAPYRNAVMVNDLLKTLDGDSMLLIASDISGENEFIQCRSVRWWKENPPVLGKVPCIFGIGK